MTKEQVETNTTFNDGAIKKVLDVVERKLEGIFTDMVSENPSIKIHTPSKTFASRYNSFKELADKFVDMPENEREEILFVTIKRLSGCDQSALAEIINTVKSRDTIRSMKNDF